MVVADPPSGGTRRKPTRHLLAVGVEKYDDASLGNLQFSCEDAQAIADCLSSLRYSIDLLTDKATRPTRDNVRAALARLEGTFHRKDYVWVHVSSHGVLRGNRPYLFMADSKVGDVERTGIAIDEIVVRLNATGSRRWVLTVDACHSGVQMSPVLPSIEKRQVGLGCTDDDWVYYVCEQAEGNAILAACTATQSAAEARSSGHGVFTAGLIEALKNPDFNKRGYQTLNHLRDQVIVYVGKQYESRLGTGRPQTPSYEIRGTGELLLFDTRPKPEEIEELVPISAPT
jgi:uncharacterized caspase-like protein